MDYRNGLKIALTILAIVLAAVVGPPISRFLARQAALSEMSTREGVERRLQQFSELDPSLVTLKRSFPRDYAALVNDIQQRAVARNDDAIVGAIVSRPIAVVDRDRRFLAQSPLPAIMRVVESERQMFDGMGVRRCAALLRSRPVGDPTPNELVLANRWQDARLQAIAAGRDTPSPPPSLDEATIREFRMALRGERTSDDAWRVIFKQQARTDASDAAVCKAHRNTLRALRVMPPRAAAAFAGSFFG